MGQVLALAISAVLLAGFYASMAYGLGLIYGVLRVVNLAHGGMIMAAAYLSWVLFTRFSIDPYLAIPVVMVVFFFIGVAMYKGLVRFLPRGAAGGVQSLLLLFGVWLVIRNIAYLFFSGDDQAVRTSYSTSSPATASDRAATSNPIAIPAAQTCTSSMKMSSASGAVSGSDPREAHHRRRDGNDRCDQELSAVFALFAGRASQPRQDRLPEGACRPLRRHRFQSRRHCRCRRARRRKRSRRRHALALFVGG